MRDRYVEITDIEGLREVMKTDRLPSHVVEDINKRINDWLESGGSEKDIYIKNQINYANRVLSRSK